MHRNEKDREGDSPLDRILRESERLFACKGFSGVTTREIAAAVGLNIATVHYHAGTKRELYQMVHQRLREEERAFIAELLEYAVKTAVPESHDLDELARRLIGLAVDFVARDPSRVRFMVRHWLEAGEHSRNTGKSGEHLPDPYQQISELLHMAEAEETTHLASDTGMFLRGFFGILYSHFAFRTFSWEDQDSTLDASPNVDALKAFLHSYTVRMLGLTNKPLDASRAFSE